MTWWLDRTLHGEVTAPAVVCLVIARREGATRCPQSDPNGGDGLDPTVTLFTEFGLCDVAMRGERELRLRGLDVEASMVTYDRTCSIMKNTL
jgi:hypothetical protein